MKSFFLVIVSGAIISLILSFIASGDFLLKLIDFYFYYGLIVLICGIFLFVSGKGFFDFFRWSSKKVFSGYNNSYEDYKSSDEATPLEFSIAKPLICSGGLIIFITYIIALAAY